MNLRRTARFFPRRLALTAAVAALACTAPSTAAPLLYFGLDNSAMGSPLTNANAARIAFRTAVGPASIATQTFETATADPANLPASFDGTFANGVGVTVDNSATIFLRISEGPGAFETYPISGTKYLEASSDPGSTYFTATFHQAVRAIGFYVTDASDWNCCPDPRNPIGELKVVLTTASGSTEYDLTPGFTPEQLLSGNALFFGAFDDANPFTSISIRSESNITDEDLIGIDDVMISIQAVPAPGTLALLLGLLPVLGFLRRRPA